ncbi:MAG: hypothetical protein OHK0012_20580 [Synechococcales cyanobacterium]
MAGLLIVALLVAGVFWFGTSRILGGDPEPTVTPSAAEQVPPTPIPPQRIEQVTDEVQQSLEAAQERLNQAQQQLEGQ